MAPGEKGLEVFFSSLGEGFYRPVRDITDPTEQLELSCFFDCACAVENALDSSENPEV